jgi:hypothetical protein
MPKSSAIHLAALSLLITDFPGLFFIHLTEDPEYNCTFCFPREIESTS